LIINVAIIGNESIYFMAFDGIPTIIGASKKKMNNIRKMGCI